jgi:hypothetical protein
MPAEDNGSLSNRTPAGSPVPARQNTADTPRNSDGGPSNRRRKLSDIKSKLLRPSLTSQYACKFDLPIPVRNWTAEKKTPFNYQNQDLIEISCSEAALPGSSLMTHDITNDFSGVSEKHVYRRAYDQVASFTFMVDHDYTIIKIFENWMSYIVGEQFASSGGRPGIEDENYFYRVRYPEQYQTDNLYITKFEKDYADDISAKALQYKFIKAFPLSIVTMPISYEASQLLKCTVNFAYTRYTIRQENMANRALRVTQETRDPGIPGTKVGPATGLLPRGQGRVPLIDAFLDTTPQTS